MIDLEAESPKRSDAVAPSPEELQLERELHQIQARLNHTLSRLEPEGCFRSFNATLLLAAVNVSDLLMLLLTNAWFSERSGKASLGDDGVPGIMATMAHKTFLDLEHALFEAIQARA